MNVTDTVRRLFPFENEEEDLRRMCKAVSPDNQTWHDFCNSQRALSEATIRAVIILPYLV